MHKKHYINIMLTFALILISTSYLFNSDIALSQNTGSHNYYSNLINIKNSNGKLYAYIVLLFNENPHFVNLIQEDSIPIKMMQKEGFHIIAYKNYMHKIKNYNIRKIASIMYSIYNTTKKYNAKKLNSIEHVLAKRNIILRFSIDSSSADEKIILDYCILGKKRPINIIHPLFNIKEKIYNIQPLIYYDEFSTSNSTFYFDMIYINPEEVQNDYIIAKNILMNINVESKFFVGARVTDDIKYCLRRAFKNYRSIKKEITRMFEIHELTHKILNNHYNFFDQVIGEELALSSTIYSNPYLGLSVLYSYLDYSTINPHRLAAMNFIRYIANRTGKLELIDNPSQLKKLSISVILKLTKEHFHSIIKSIK